MKNEIIIAVVTGSLVIGLVVGVFIGSALYPSMHSGVGTHNQVRVSGTVLETGIYSIQFSSVVGSNITVDTTAVITNGVYSVVVVAGQSYSITLYSDQYGTVYSTSTLYVPSGVSTFHADF